MGRMLQLMLTMPLLTVPALAHADRGALSLDLGGGGTATLLRSPTPQGFSVTTPTTTPVTSASASFGVRYALTNHLELAAAGFFEPSVPVFHNSIVLTSTTPPVSSYPGTMSDHYSRYGALGGARWVWGAVWRLSVGGELGWAHQSYTSLVHWDDRSPTSAIDYHLALRDLALDSAVLSGGAGLEWAFSDKMSIAIMPRLHLLVGRQSVPSLTIPVVFTYSWYL